MSQAGQVQRDGRARGATAVPVREGGVKERGSQDPTPHSSTVAWTVEGGLEVVEGEERSPQLDFEARKGRGGGALAIIRWPSKGPVCVYLCGLEDKLH